MANYTAKRPTKHGPPAWAIRTAADRLAIEQGCYWDAEAARSIVWFAEHVFRPQYIAGKFKLQQWQRRFLQSVVSWRLPDGRIRIRLANLTIGKKNGKSLLCGLLCSWAALFGKDPSQLIVLGAASKENATQVFDECVNTIKHSPFANYAKITRNTKVIKFEEANATIKCVASDGDRVHGWNCSLVVLDECHAHKDASLYQALRYATDARDFGQVVLISTAGNDTSHYYYGVYNKAKKILSGEDTDITTYAEVYESDPGDDTDLEDPEQWKKANPSLGVSFTEDQFRRDLQAAKTNVGDWLNFQQLKLNRWVVPSDHAWISTAAYDTYRLDIDDAQLKTLPCAIGVDTSQTTDPSSVSCVWKLPSDKYYVRSWAWVAKEGVMLRDKTELISYRQFVGEGSMTMTDGDRIDDKLILRKILDLCKTYRVASVNFDPTSAYVLMGLVEQEGYDVQRFPQTFRNYNGVMREFEKAWLEGRIYHDGSTWLRYCLGNVRVETNRYDEIRPFKRASKDKIDGAIAALLAFNTAFLLKAKRTITTGGFY